MAILVIQTAALVVATVQGVHLLILVEGGHNSAPCGPLTLASKNSSLPVGSRKQQLPLQPLPNYSIASLFHRLLFVSLSFLYFLLGESLP